MKRPAPPPDVDAALRDMDVHKLLTALDQGGGGPRDSYLPWDKIRFKNPPGDFTHVEWWAAIKLGRRQMQRPLPLMDSEGKSFSFALPDVILEALEQVDRNASGQIGASEQVTNPATRDRYLISSLIEEAINSSQLEGASTTRQVAKEMIRAGRRPHTRDERMILNNYAAMRKIGDIRHEKLTPELICEIHRIVTEGTLENPDSSGRFQQRDEPRVGVYTDSGDLLHVPPPAETLPERINRLCDFANGELDTGYVPPTLRAITIHFMIGYDHPFEDGNGRTARALFYWAMLNQGYWLTEYLAISPALKNAPARYAKSYLYTEDDENDLTYFFHHQLNVLSQAIQQLHDYLSRKAREIRELQQKITGAMADFNHRQIALLGHATRNVHASVSVQSHMLSHNISQETARKDLLALERLGLLTKTRRGRAFVWTPAPDLEERVRRLETTT